MNILAQRDTRWKDLKIGASNSTIGNFGCAITCLAMLANTTPDIINNHLTTAHGYLEDRIIWSTLNKTNCGLTFPDNGRKYSYDNKGVLQAIKDNGGCLVEVDFDGVISTPNDRHWVLFIGNNKAYDPWTGTEISTSKYPILKGYCVINVVKHVEQVKEDVLSDNEQRILSFVREKNITESQVRTGYGWITENYDEQIRKLKTENNELKAKIEELSKPEHTCQSSDTSANENSDMVVENDDIVSQDQIKNIFEKLFSLIKKLFIK